MTSLTLQPVASPVDTFVQPGVPGPKVTNFDFGALRGLSQTLDQVANDENQRKIAEAQRQAAEDTPRLERLAKAQWEVLNSKDPLTAEQMKTLRDAGIQSVDNPWAIQLLQKASGVEQVRQADLYGYLRDPAWFGEVARVAAMSPGYADQMVQKRLDDFNKKLGAIGNENAKLSAAVAISQEVDQFKKEMVRARAQQFDIQQERAAAMALQPAMDLGVSLYTGQEPDPELEQKFRYGLAIFRDQQKSTMDPAKADRVFAQALENSLLNLAKQKDGAAAMHVMDSVRDALKDDPNILPMLDQVEAHVERATRERSVSDEREITKARSTLENRLVKAAYAKDPSMTPRELADWIYKGEGLQVLEQVSKEFPGISEDLLGEGQQSAYAFISRMSQSDNDAQVLAVVQATRDGNPSEAEALLGVSDGISMSTRLNLMDRIDAKKKEPSVSSEAKQARGVGSQALLTSLGNLPDSTANTQSELVDVYNSAFTEFLNQPGNGEKYDQAKAAARAAAQSSQAFARLQQVSSLNTFSGLQKSPDYRPVEQMFAQLRADSLQTAMSEGKADGAFDALGFAEDWANIESRADQEIRGFYSDLKNSPEIQGLPTVEQQNSEIASRIKAFVPEAIRRAKGISQQKAPSLAALPKTSKDQVARFEATQKVQVQPSLTPAGQNNPAYLGILTSMARAVNLTSASAGTDAFYELYALGPENKKVDDTASWTLGMGLALEAHIVDNLSASAASAPSANPNIGSLPAYIARSVGSRKEALENYKTFILARGLSMRELANGRTDGGVDLQEVFGTQSSPWFVNIPIKHIPVFGTKEDVDAAVMAMGETGPASGLYRAMKSLRLDPEDSKAVDAFTTWQKKLIEDRSGADAWLGSADKRAKEIRKLMQEVPKIRSDDPEWVKRAKQRRIDAENQ